MVGNASNNSVERDARKLRLQFPSPSAPAAPHVKRYASRTVASI